jgi:hypothetical protein
VLSFGPKQWNDCDDIPLDSWTLFPRGWEWRYDHDPWVQLGRGYEFKPTFKFIYIKPQVSHLLALFKETHFYRNVRGLHRYRQHTSETEIKMLLRGPREDDKLIYSHPWPQGAKDELMKDGTFRQVHIL